MKLTDVERFVHVEIDRKQPAKISSRTNPEYMF